MITDHCINPDVTEVVRMAEVVLFHHAQGLTPGVTAFAEELRREGHTVHTPDLYDGRTFDTIDAGMAYSEQVGGVTEILDRGARAVAELPAGVVYLGFSLGVLNAQKLAQTRPGASGAVLVYACVPTSYFGPWPAAVPVRIHAMDADPIFNGEGDAEAARALVKEAPDAELYLYPGDQHYFADSSLPSYDADATALLLQRTASFLRSR
jgi:dienelactone hydrolase